MKEYLLMNTKCFIEVRQGSRLSTADLLRRDQRSFIDVEIHRR